MSETLWKGFFVKVD